MPRLSQPMTAPYAPAKNVVGIIQRFRERRLPQVISARVLAQAGVPQGNAPRTLAALKFLGLVHEDEEITESFMRLSQATSAQYREQLAQILRSAYAPIFKQVDPTTADDIALDDAFRQYLPHAQREKMISLFRGLAQQAGIMESSKPRLVLREPRPSRREKDAHAGRSSDPSEVDASASASEKIPSDYHLFVPLLQQLPEDGSWTREQRDRWLHAFEGNLDLIIEIRE